MNSTVRNDISSSTNNVVSIDDIAEDKVPKIRITMEKQYVAFHFRVYAETFGAPDGTDGDEAVEILSSHLCHIKDIPSDKYFVDGAIHDMDTALDDIINPKGLKVHGHIVVQHLGKKPNGKPCAVRVRTVLKMLEQCTGMRYRLEYPSKVKIHKKNKDGKVIETERDGRIQDAPDFHEFNAIKVLDLRRDDVTAMVAYLDHDTQDARSDGKYQYLPIGENPYRWSNNIEHSKALIEKYHSQMDYLRTDKGAVVLSKAEWKMKLRREAFDLGKSGQSYLPWYKSLPDNLLCGEYDRLTEKWYDLGADEYLSSHSGIDNVRCSIFIDGTKDLGKSYNSVLALQDMGLKILQIDGGKTGKFDELTSDTDALVVSDTGLMDYYAVTDDKWCRLYRRNCSNPLWCGKYLIITYNGSFDEYMKQYAPDLWSDERTSDDRKDALRSRFFMCKCTEDGLKVHFVGGRGYGEKRDARVRLFLDFFDRFNRFQTDFISHKRADEQSKEKSPEMARLDALMGKTPSLVKEVKPSFREPTKEHGCEDCSGFPHCEDWKWKHCSRPFKSVELPAEFKDKTSDTEFDSLLDALGR